MDANNLTLCLWPTLCPIELPSDMARFEGIRVEISEIISTIILEYDKIFEPNYSSSPVAAAATSHMGSLAQEAAEAARLRGARNLSGSGINQPNPAISPQRSNAPLLPSSHETPATQNGNSVVKASILASLKSVQV